MAHSEAHQSEMTEGLPSLVPIPSSGVPGERDQGQGEWVAGAEGALPCPVPLQGGPLLPLKRNIKP